MARGGKRPGAGRPKGSVNRVSRARRVAYASSGEDPVQFMLGIMRNPEMPMDLRADMAKAAAPYVHPRLTAVQHSGHNGGPVEVVRRVIVDVQDPGNPDGTGLPAAS